MRNRLFLVIGLLLNMGFCLESAAQLAAGQAKYLGNIGGNSIPADFGSLWNQITPENGGKWMSVESTKDKMNWYSMDVSYNYSQNHGIPVRFHTLVWGQQQPSWITSLPPEEQKAQVEEWFRLVAARYPKLDMIDVVNEPLLSHAPATYREALGGSGTTGWDWVIWCFEKARTYFPNAKLHINDYGILSSGTNVQEYAKIIRLLKDRGLIDGIGCQGHFLETTPASIVRSNLANLATLQLPIYITEFDLNLADDTQQLNKYRELFPILWEHPAVKGITLWGYRQGSIWRENAFLIQSDAKERPALTWLREYFTPAGTNITGKPGISVFPNPAANYLHISGAGNYDLEIYAISGKLLHRETIREASHVIPLSTFKEGYILCRLSSSGSVLTFTIFHRKP